MDTIIMAAMAATAVILCIILFLFQKKSGEVGKLGSEMAELKRILEQKDNEFQQVKADYTRKLKSSVESATNAASGELEEIKRKLEDRNTAMEKLQAKYTLDLEQAEANLDEIKAGNELALSAAQQELDGVKNELGSTRKKLKKLQQQPAAPAEGGGDEELNRLELQLNEKTKALEDLEASFESQMDEVVQSSIQKISHAEQAKEEAIQAATDNYDAAAEAYAVIKEKDDLIKKLQG